MGGDTTSLNAKGKAKTDESKDVKSRTYRVNMNISLDCLTRKREESREPRRNKSGMACAIILASRVNVRQMAPVDVKCSNEGFSAYEPA